MNDLNQEQLNTYELKKQARIERYQARALKAQERAEQADQGSDKIFSSIPMGQPILVGHHSEKRHRRYLEKGRRLLNRASEEKSKAKYWANRAESAEKSTAIFSDDPEAVQKLQEKIAAAENLHAEMKRINRDFKSLKGDWSKIDKTEGHQLLIEIGKRNLSFQSSKPFSSYALASSSSNIRRMKKRLEELEHKQSEVSSTQTIGEVSIVENVEENRCQLFFPGKPSDEIRSYLKQHGFRWSRFNGCWQRHRSNQASFVAAEVVKLMGA